MRLQPLFRVFVNSFSGDEVISGSNRVSSSKIDSSPQQTSSLFRLHTLSTAVRSIW